MKEFASELERTANRPLDDFLVERLGKDLPRRTVESVGRKVKHFQLDVALRAAAEERHSLRRQRTLEL